ncbi:MAG TPA: type II toxin-antitoxin system prevent-host-death family antitoxin [Polyangia bacterium]
MGKPFNLYQAKTHLSTLVDRAAAGEELIIAKAGRPLARLVPLAKERPRRRSGFLKGRVRVARDFDRPLSPEVLTEREPSR